MSSSEGGRKSGEGSIREERAREERKGRGAEVDAANTDDDVAAASEAGDAKEPAEDVEGTTLPGVTTLVVLDMGEEAAAAAAAAAAVAAMREAVGVATADDDDDVVVP